MKNFKKVLALVLVVAMMMSFVVVASAKTTADYTDADKVTYTKAVDVLSYLGVLEGTNDAFRPTDTLNRAEAAKIIAMFANGSTEISTLYTGVATTFTDVKGHWAESFINYCYAAGIVSGKSATTFDPKSNVTGAEFLKMALIVLGFDADKEGLKGSLWAINTLKKATAKNLTADLAKGWDPAKDITREEAAQVMFNALNQTKVAYTSFAVQAGQVVAVAANTDNYLRDTWNVGKTETKTDDWGRPYYEWVDDKGTTKKADDVVVATYKATPVATYNEKFAECDVCKELDGSKTVSFESCWTNGVKNEHYTAYKASSTDTHGAQGRLVEIYDVTPANAETKSYRMVAIDTYLAQAGKPVAEKTLANGNVKEIAYQPLAYYNAGALNTKIKGNDYAEDEYLLINVNAAKKTTINNAEYAKVEVVGKPETLTAKLTGYNTVKKTYTYDETYIEAANYLGEIPAIGTTYDLYFDQFGNLIAQKAHENEKTYAILDQVKTETGDWSVTPYGVAKLIDLEGKESVVKVSKYYQADGTTVAEDPTTWTVGEAKHDLVKVVEKTNGVELTKVGTEIAATGKITKGTPYIYDNTAIQAVTDASTLFIVETGTKHTFTVYTGYEAVPSVRAAKIIYANTDTDAYVDLVYVDATNTAIFTGSEKFAYVLTDATEFGEAVVNGTTYNMVSGIIVDGAVQDYVLMDDDVLTTVESKDNAGVMLEFNADGAVITVTDVALENKTVTAKGGLGIVGLGGVNYAIASDAVIWVYDSTTGKCTVGTDASFVTTLANVQVAFNTSGAIAKAIILK